MTKNRMPDVAEIEDVHEAAQFVASIIEHRNQRLTRLPPEQLRHLAAALAAVADGDVEKAKDAIEDALRQEWRG